MALFSSSMGMMEETRLQWRGLLASHWTLIECFHTCAPLLDLLMSLTRLGLLSGGPFFLLQDDKAAVRSMHE